MWPFDEGGLRRKAPRAGTVRRDDANLRIAIKDRHHAVRFRRTGEGRRCIVGGIAADHGRGGVADIIGDVNNHRGGGAGVNHDGEACRWCTLVARRIGLTDGEDVIALRQRGRREAPVTRLADHGGAQQGAVAVNGDGIARRAATGKGWAVVIGGLPVCQWAGARADIINNRANNRRVGRGEINGDGRRRRTSAGFAIQRGGDLKGVRSFTQRQSWRIGPVAVCIGGHGWQQNLHTVLVDGNYAAWLCRPDKGRRRVVGGFVFHIARDRGRIVVDDRNDGHVREIRQRTSDGIGGFRAEITCGIRGGDGQRRAVLLGRAERHGEVAA